MGPVCHEDGEERGTLSEQLCWTRDEGRTLGGGVQAQTPNYPLLLPLREVVVNEMGKGWARPNQVRIEETNASEPLMKCRNTPRKMSKPRMRTYCGRKRRRQPEYCLRGIRHEGGVKSIQALERNVGTCHSDEKGEAQMETP